MLRLLLLCQLPVKRVHSIVCVVERQCNLATLERVRGPGDREPADLIGVDCGKGAALLIHRPLSFGVHQRMKEKAIIATGRKRADSSSKARTTRSDRRVPHRGPDSNDDVSGPALLGWLRGPEPLLRSTRLDVGVPPNERHTHAVFVVGRAARRLAHGHLCDRLQCHLGPSRNLAHRSTPIPAKCPATVASNSVTSSASSLTVTA